MGMTQTTLMSTICSAVVLGRLRVWRGRPWRLISQFPALTLGGRPGQPSSHPYIWWQAKCPVNDRSLSGLPRREKGGLSQGLLPGQFR
jgi:hypothetical protein